MSNKKRPRTKAQIPAGSRMSATKPNQDRAPAAKPRRVQFILPGLLIVAVIGLAGLWWNALTPAPQEGGATGPAALQLSELVATPAQEAVSQQTLPSPTPTASTVTQLAGPSPIVAAADYVGRAVCAACHAEEDRLWRGSHHDLAMQEASAATVLGDFADKTFTYNDITSRFFRRGDRFFVNTDGADGELADFPIKFTFGVWPLQQYLIEFAGGRLQALPLAWDARTEAEGGQRWFHLYPDERIDHRDQLHWTGLYQNWNLQCAACHSTNLKKGYDTASNTYETTFSELNVSCEACHGPGSDHVEWASRATAPYPADDAKGLSVVSQSRWDEAWGAPATGAGIPRRDRPADSAVMNTCSACHALRSTLAENGAPGAPLADTHRLALLTPPMYHADGQQRGEVYVWGSFLQSRMFQQGVTCLDCHEPHTAKLRVEDNALCTRCHDAARFDAPKHHFHEPETAGAQCVECHMPAQNYMVVDARRDHAIRPPRPDLSQTLGSPNACTQCHADKQPEWAVSAMDRWYGTNWRERPHFGITLHAGETQGAAAVPALLQLAQDTTSPALVRATAAALLRPHMRPDMLIAARELMKDPDPEVRIVALGLIEPADPVNRVLAAAPLLEDPVRGVRIEAARILADVPDADLPEIRRAARDLALKEYRSALKFNSDWPTENVALGNLYMRQGKIEEALAAYERALMLDDQFAGAYVNLANAYRLQGREDKGEQTLSRGLTLLPQVADLRHALGLSLVRSGDAAASLAEFKLATELAPENVRYSFVYAVALHSEGRVDEALNILREVDANHPNRPDILGTLISIYRETGDKATALDYARKLAAALPEDAAVRRLLTEMEGGN